MIRTLLRGVAPLLRAAVGKVRLVSSRPGRAPRAATGDVESLEPRRMLSAAHARAIVVDSGDATQATYVSARPAATSPSTLSARLVSPTGVRLSWRTRTAEVQKTRVYYKLSKSPAWVTAATLPGSKTVHTAKGLKPGRTYNFLVQEVLPGGTSVYSNPTSVALPVAAEAPLPAEYSGPIEITRGGTYRGKWQSLDPDVPAVQVHTSEPVVIEGSIIRSRGTLISSYGYAANLTIRNTSGYGLNPNVAGRQGGRFLNLVGFTNVVVEHNYLQSTCGIYLEKYKGNHTAGQTITVRDNSARNIDGRLSDGNGGYLPTPAEHYVQFFQTNGLQRVRGAEVAWNQVVNEPGKSLVEDNISIYDTTGTPDSPFQIHDNFIDGAYPIDPAVDGEYTGGGIMLSDRGSAYVAAFGNQVINTTNYGIAISSGHDNEFYENRILSGGVLSDGTPVVAQNIGAYIWNGNGEADFSNNRGHDNLVGWEGPAGRNDLWFPDASDPADEDSNTAWDGEIGSDLNQAEGAIWAEKLTEAGLTTGPIKA